MAFEKNPRKDGFEMWGEFCRDAAVLVLIFAFLEKVIKPTGLDFYNLLKVLGVSFVFMVAGLYCEKWRKL